MEIGFDEIPFCYLKCIIRYRKGFVDIKNNATFAAKLI